MIYILVLINIILQLNYSNAQNTAAQVIPLFHLNSSYNEHSAILLPNYMFFTSNRPTKYTDRNYSNKHHFEQIYFSNRRQNLFERPYHKKMRLSANDYSIAGHSDNPYLFILYSGKEGFGNFYFVHIDIIKDKWKIEKIRFNEPLRGSRKTSAYYQSSTNELFIVAEIESETYGGKDIYVINRFGKNKWSLPRNLGININTHEDEEGVFIFNDTLFFASKGHNSSGDFDIFYSVLQNYQWSKPTRLPEPINSRWNDLFFTRDLNTIIITSDREESQGGYDLFQVDYVPGEELKQEKYESITFSGEIIDQETYEPLFATIFIYDNDLNTFLDSIVNNIENDGKFELTLQKNRNYRILYFANNYLTQEELIETKTHANQNIYKIIRLKRNPDAIKSQPSEHQVKDTENFIVRKGNVLSTNNNPLDAMIYIYAINPFEIIDSVETYASKKGVFELKLNNQKDYRILVKSNNFKTHLEDIQAKHIIPPHTIDKNILLEPIQTTPVSVAQTKLTQSATTVQKLSSPNHHPNVSTNFEKAFEDFIKILPHEILYYQVQVGAYRNIRSIKEFRNRQPQFKNENIAMEVVGDIYKFLIADKIYSSNPDCYKLITSLHFKAIQQYKIPDAFIAAYTTDGKRIAIVWSFDEKKYKILQ